MNAHNIRAENVKVREVKIPKKLDIILRNYIKDMNSYDYMFRSRKGIGAIGVPQ